MFTDGTFGGKTKALAAAIEHRDKLLAANPGHNLLSICGILRRSNKSGIPGVARIKDVGPKGQIKIYWLAFCRAGGKRFARKFSVERFGDERAKKLAQKARKEFIENHAEIAHRRTYWQSMFETGKIT